MVFSQWFVEILCSLPHHFQHVYIDFHSIVLSCFHQLSIISCNIFSFFTINTSLSPYLIALITLPPIMASQLLPRLPLATICYRFWTGWVMYNILVACLFLSSHCWFHHSSNTCSHFVPYAGSGLVFCPCSFVSFLEYFHQLFSPCPVRYFLLVNKKYWYMVM